MVREYVLNSFFLNDYIILWGDFKNNIFSYKVIYLLIMFIENYY